VRCDGPRGHKFFKPPISMGNIVFGEGNIPCPTRRSALAGAGTGARSAAVAVAGRAKVEDRRRKMLANRWSTRLIALRTMSCAGPRRRFLCPPPRPGSAENVKLARRKIRRRRYMRSARARLHGGIPWSARAEIGQRHLFRNQRSTVCALVTHSARTSRLTLSWSGGWRSALASRTAKEMDREGVTDIDGGFGA